MDRDTAGLTQSAPVIDCAAYCRGARAALSVDQIQAALTREDQFVWIGLYVGFSARAGCSRPRSDSS